MSVLAGVGLFGGTLCQAASRATPPDSRRAPVVWTLDVVAPQRDTADQEIVLPGEVRAWYTAPIHARVTGYVKMWYKDIGARVRAGDVLAEIDTPALDQQLEHAKGELKKSEARLGIAELTAKRWAALRAANAVSIQDADEKMGAYKAALAEVVAAKARVARLEALKDFRLLKAPFDGVVIARKVDVGALVHATQPNATELFEVADVREMRIYVDVPQPFAAQIRPGMTATFELPGDTDHVFHPVVATTSNFITKHSRTLLVQLHCENKDRLLLPGSYVEVRFRLPPNENILLVPASALIFREAGSQVAVVGYDGRVTLKQVKVWRDLGNDMEIVSGLAASDRIVRNPPDSIKDGDIVHATGPAVACNARHAKGRGHQQCAKAGDDGKRGPAYRVW